MPYIVDEDAEDVLMFCKEWSPLRAADVERAALA
jgi:hypothetical protein